MELPDLILGPPLLVLANCKNMESLGAQGSSPVAVLGHSEGWLGSWVARQVHGEVACIEQQPLQNHPNFVKHLGFDE